MDITNFVGVIPYGNLAALTKVIMNIKSLLCTAAVLFSIVTTGAQSAPLSATYTASGSAGHWVYDFTFTSNITNQKLYYFGALVDSGTVKTMAAGLLGLGIAARKTKQRNT